MIAADYRSELIQQADAAEERYPTAFGSGPVVNLVAGWACLALGALALSAADLPSKLVPGGAAVAVGVLLIGLFHAKGLAFGRE